MLSAEQNERLTRVGPGTPGGELMRRYWQPFLPTAKLLENPVQKVRLLGEDLVCYKDRSGSYGLIGPNCAHRLVGMEYGIPQEHGIRCPYHGWCYDESGACTDTPLEPANSRLKNNVHLKGYPVQEMGGLLFAYMGPSPAPLLPPWELFVWPNAVRQIGYSVINCNWLQCNENLADPAHVVYCHGYFFQYILERMGLLKERVPDPAKHIAYYAKDEEKGFSHIISEKRDFGLQKACVYKQELGAEKDHESWHSATIFPHNVRVGGPGSMRQEYQIRVPIDDTHTYHIDYEIYIAPDGVEVAPQDVIPYYESPIFDENGDPVLDYVLSQDMVCWWSQGAIVDRTSEHLGVTDSAVVQFRNLLEEEISKVERGEDPMNTWREPAEMPDILIQEPKIGEVKRLAAEIIFDNGDRYGPVVDDIVDLSKRVAEFQARK